MTDYCCADVDGQACGDPAPFRIMGLPVCSMHVAKQHHKLVGANGEKIGGYSEGEELLARQLKAEGIAFERQFRWHPERAWLVDFWLARFRLLIEVQGGTEFGRSRHSRGHGFEEDCRKLAEAQRMGLVFLAVTPGMVKSGEAMQMIRRAVGRVR